MKDLETIKDEYAKEKGFGGFDALSWRMGIKEDCLNEIAERYALEYNRYH